MTLATIKQAERAKELPATDKRGPLIVWKLELDSNGKTIIADMLRKPESPDPSGQVELSQDDQGRWKAKFPQQNGRGGGRSPADTKAIQRQHSQEMALRYADIQDRRGKLPNDFDLRTLEPIIAWFEKDIAS